MKAKTAGKEKKVRERARMKEMKVEKGKSERVKRCIERIGGRYR